MNKLPPSSDGPSKNSRYSRQSKSVGRLPPTKLKKKKKKPLLLKKGELSYLS